MSKFASDVINNRLVMNRHCYLYFLSNVRNLGASRIRNIVEKCRTADEFFSLSDDELSSFEGIDASAILQIREASRNRKSVEDSFSRLIEKLNRHKAGICSVFDDEYPVNLKTVPSPPVLLFYKGMFTGLDRFSMAIVGTRVPTEYGKHTCDVFASEISSMGIPVVSGFARGIDTIAHKASLKTGNPTYAVFGCGIDVIYPAENRSLYHEIAENGVLISEFPPGAKPDKVNFPRRNRIISGISLGTIVIESGISGGAVLTAEIALEQNKEVFAVPGYIHSRQSQGTNELIKKGYAKLVTGIEDVVCELERKLSPLLNKQLTLPLNQPRVNITKEERFIFEVIKREPLHIDSISNLSGKPVQECLVHLLSLEFKLLVRQLPGKFFSLN